MAQGQQNNNLVGIDMLSVKHQTMQIHIVIF